MVELGYLVYGGTRMSRMSVQKTQAVTKGTIITSSYNDQVDGYIVYMPNTAPYAPYVTSLASTIVINFLNTSKNSMFWRL